MGEYRNVRRWDRSTVPVRLIAKGEGYAMVRRKGCAPFIVTLNDWNAGDPCDAQGESK